MAPALVRTFDDSDSILLPFSVSTTILVSICLGVRWKLLKFRKESQRKIDRSFFILNFNWFLFHRFTIFTFVKVIYKH